MEHQNYKRWSFCSKRNKLEDKFENMGAQMVKEVASKTSNNAEMEQQQQLFNTINCLKV